MLEFLFGSTTSPRRKAASTDTDTKRYLAVVPSLIQQAQSSQEKISKRIEKRVAITIPYYITEDRKIYILVNESQRQLSPLIRYDIPSNILGHDLFDNINISVKQAMSNLIGIEWSGIVDESVIDLEYLTGSHFIITSNETQIKVYVALVPYLTNSKVNKDVLNIVALSDHIKFYSSFNLSPMLLLFDDFRRYFLHENSNNTESFSCLGCTLTDEFYNLCSKTTFISELNNHFEAVFPRLVENIQSNISNTNYYDIMNNISSGSLPNSEIIVDHTREYYSPITLSGNEISNFGITTQHSRTQKSSIRLRQDNHTNKYILPKCTNSLSKDFFNNAN